MTGSSYNEQYKLLEELITSFESVKSVEVDYIDVSRITKTIHKLSFDDVKKSVVYPRDESSEEVYKIQLPVINEALFIGFKESDPLPASGYLIKLDSKIIEKPMGILEVQIRGFETYINESDNRHPKDRLSFFETANFIYDYKNNVYDLVNEKELNATRFGMERKGLQLEQVKDGIVQEFLVRERKLKDALGVLKPLARVLQKQVISANEIKKTDESYRSSNNSYQRYLEAWGKVITSVENWIYLKFVYSQVSWVEVQLVMKKRRDFLDKIDQSIYRLNKIQENLKGFNEISQGYENFKYANKISNELEASFFDRGTTSRSGFFIMKNELGVYEIVENFKEIENRHTLSINKYTEEDIEREKESILNKWKESRN